MKRYAPVKLELASRDVVSRAMMTEIEEGRGFGDGEGLEYLISTSHRSAPRRSRSGLAASGR